MKRRIIRPGESLAIATSAIHADATAMWWDYSGRTPDNARAGNVAVVSIRDSLDHHAGYGDNYEAILERTRKAMSGEDVVEVARRKSWYDDSIVVSDAVPPKCVVLKIDSPGGVCSGLNETVFALRRMSKESGIPLIAFVDELAASAAYALACACDEIFMPPSAIAGSIGVISCMYDQTETDKKVGVKFVTLKSGARKDDGHPHVPLTDAATNAEQRRVDRLAKQFFKIVAAARPLSVDEIASYQAGIYVGSEAVARGLADDIMSFDVLTSTLNEEKPLAKYKKSGSSNSTGVTLTVIPSKGSKMSVSLKLLVQRTASALASEKDPKKKKALEASLATHQATLAALDAMKKEKHTIEKHESEESTAEEDAEAEEEEKAEAGASDDDDEDDDDEDKKKDDEDDDEDAKAEAAAAKSLLGASATPSALKAIAKLVRKANAYDSTRKDVEALKAAAVLSSKNSMIDAALGGGGKPPRITSAEAIALRGATTSQVKFFLSTRKGAIVNTDSTIEQPDAKGNTKPTALSAETMKIINAAVGNAPGGIDRDKLRADLITSHTKALLNGAGTY